MDQHWLRERLRDWGNAPALIWRDDRWSYLKLDQAIGAWLAELMRNGIVPGDVVAIRGDYSPNTCALLLASLLNGNIIVPLTLSSARGCYSTTQTAEVGYAVEFDGNDAWRFASYQRPVADPLLRALVERRAPGLILFSSGSDRRKQGFGSRFHPAGAQRSTRLWRFQKSRNAADGAGGFWRDDVLRIRGSLTRADQRKRGALFQFANRNAGPARRFSVGYRHH